MQILETKEVKKYYFEIKDLKPFKLKPETQEKNLKTYLNWNEFQ